jgi:spore coat polysaccharide biosynthesis predicted glycosyltransferase SpsG
LNSDLCFGAGGTTTWERLYLGLPSIVTIISSDQKESVEFLSDKGHIINLGLAKNITTKTYVETLQKLNPDLLYNMSLNNQKLVDGNGSIRIKEQLIELINDA